MNSKKAKRLRQLVKHLQTKGVIEDKDWAVYGSQQHKSSDSDPENPKWIVQQTRMLDPACGKAIYKQMKTRSHISGKV